MLERLVAWLVATLGVYGGWGIAWAMLVESACIPLPSEVILPFGGFLAAQGQITLFTAMWSAVVGAMVGSALTYWIGAWGGRPLLARYGKYVLISPKEIDHADHWFARRGEITVFIGRLLPGVRTFISLPAGIARMNFGRFLWYSFLGIVPWTILFTWAGYQLGAHWDIMRPYLHKVDLVIIVLLVVLVGLFVNYKIRSSRTPH